MKVLVICLIIGKAILLVICIIQLFIIKRLKNEDFVSGKIIQEYNNSTETLNRELKNVRSTARMWQSKYVELSNKTKRQKK